MAKRHHQSKRSRAHERRGMEHFYGEHVTKAGREHESEAMHKAMEHHPHHPRHPHLTAKDRKDEGKGFREFYKEHPHGYEHHSQYKSARHHSPKPHHSHHMDPRDLMEREHYAGEEMRRKHEMADWGMINEDHNAVANLPQMVYYHSYFKAHEGIPSNIDDTIRGIDSQVDEDDSQAMRSYAPRKF